MNDGKKNFVGTTEYWAIQKLNLVVSECCERTMNTHNIGLMVFGMIDLPVDRAR